MILIIAVPLIIFGLIVLIDFTSRRQDIKKLHPYFSRVGFTCLYIAISIFLQYSFKENIFYITQNKDFTDWPRFIWCIICSCIGFALIASQVRFNPKLPYGPYLLYYPLLLVMFSSLVYSILSIFEATSSHLFYYLSFSFCFVLAFLVDRCWDIFIRLIDRILK